MITKYFSLFTILLIIFASIFGSLVTTSIAYAQILENPKINIYYFHDESKSNLYRYYSYIIPDSIAAELKLKTNYHVTVLPITFKYVTPQTDDNEKNRIIEMIISRGKEVAANYTIIGSYYVENNVIHIQTQICNITTGELIDAYNSKEEIVALIYEITETIAMRINNELKKLYKQKELEYTKQKYTQFYNNFSDIIFGYTYTYVYIQGSWKDLYNNTDMSNIFLLIPMYKFLPTDFILIKQLYFGPFWQLFSTDNTNKNSDVMSYFTVSTGGIALQYIFPVFKFLDLSFNVGGGMSHSEIYIKSNQDEENENEEGGPFASYTKAVSLDPYITTTFNAIFRYYSIGFIVGCTYSSILYKERLVGLGINIGLQYKM